MPEDSIVPRVVDQLAPASGGPRMTRRSVLRAGVAAGVGFTLVSRGLPAWARPVVDLTGLRRPGSRPFPRRPEGEHSIAQIQHVVVVMMENHSFDNVLGMLPHRVRSRRNVDGLPVSRTGAQLAVNLDAQGQPHPASHSLTVCPPRTISQTWNASHVAWNNGRNDGFVSAGSPEAMAFYDRGDLPFTYSLASHFPVGERYFCSVLAQTYPNRRFLFSGTASGTIATDPAQTLRVPAANGTIFDRLDRLGISWKTYYTNAPSMAIIPGALTPARLRHIVRINHYYADAAAGRLPQVSFVEPDVLAASEENPQDVQFGEQFVARVVRALLASPNWKHSALFLTYDEHGGYFDHVSPPAAVEPDSIKPMLNPGDVPGAYDRYGFRVPLIAVSPYARRNYVSRVVQDHTSILRFIETVWNIGAITYRDANAHNMTDYFRFHRRAILHPPKLAAAPPIAPGLAVCHAHGENPPLPLFPG
jgi:phospholipase C